MSVYMRNMEHKCTWLTPPTTSRRSLMMMEEVEHLGKVMGANLSHFFLWGWKASTVSRAEGSWPGEQTQSKDIIPKALNVPSCFISVYWLANGVFLIFYIKSSNMNALSTDIAAKVYNVFLSPSPPATTILPRRKAAAKSALFVFIATVSSDFNHTPKGDN